jgi:hypothetical protein
MSRGLADEPVQPQAQDDDEVTNVINELIKGQNKLHDRLVDLERKLDHMLADSKSETKPKPWKRGL